MPRKRQTTVGRLNPDVRSKKDIAAFEGLLGRGPLTIVLVYADWCGHCQTFKQNMWNEVSQMPEKTVNTASVHYDMVENTSLKNAKIDGYPSLLLVGTDKKPATFKTEEGATNAMPAPESVEELKSMVNTPVSEPVSNANTVATKVVNNSKTNSTNVASINTVNNIVETNVVNSNSKTVNTYRPANSSDLPVPDTAPDVTAKPAAALQQMETGQQKGGSSSQRGGNGLLATLTKITAEAGHVGTLLVAATEYPSLIKKLTRRRKRKAKKTMKKQRKQRK